MQLWIVAIVRFDPHPDNPFYFADLQIPTLVHLLPESNSRIWTDAFRKMSCGKQLR